MYKPGENPIPSGLLRRRILGAAALPVLAACGGEPQGEDTSDWQVFPCPPDARTFYEARDVNLRMSKPNGLTGLYFMNDINAPIIALTTTWDPLKIGLDTINKSPMMNSKIGFQVVSNKFSPHSSMDWEKEFAKINHEQLQRFSRTASSGLGTAVGEKSRSDWTQSFFFPRPAKGGKYAMVFGEGFTHFEGKPSPLSFVRLKLDFD